MQIEDNKFPAGLRPQLFCRPGRAGIICNSNGDEASGRAVIPAFAQKLGCKAGQNGKSADLATVVKTRTMH